MSPLEKAASDHFNGRTRYQIKRDLIGVCFVVGTLVACATNMGNTPQLSCPAPLDLPEFTEEQLAELETLSRDTQLLLIERDILQTKRIAMLLDKCLLFTE